MSYTTPASPAAPGSWWLLSTSVLVKQLAPSLIESDFHTDCWRLSSGAQGGAKHHGPHALSSRRHKSCVRGNWLSLDLYPNPLRLGLQQERPRASLLRGPLDLKTSSVEGACNTCLASLALRDKQSLQRESRELHPDSMSSPISETIRHESDSISLHFHQERQEAGRPSH